MAKLKLVVNPHFKAAIDIPVAGGDAVPVKFTFKYRTRKELKEFVEACVDHPDIDTTMEMVDGWDLDDEFTRDNVETFLDIYGGAAVALYRGYVQELLGARSKN